MPRVPTSPDWEEAARRYDRKKPAAGLESLGLSRILHTLGTALSSMSGARRGPSRQGFLRDWRALNVSGKVLA